MRSSPSTNPTGNIEGTDGVGVEGVICRISFSNRRRVIAQGTMEILFMVEINENREEILVLLCSFRFDLFDLLEDL